MVTRSRLAIVALSALIWLHLGATCLPIINLDDDDTPGNGGTPPAQLAAAILKPAQTRTVAQGTVVEVEFTASNLTGAPAIATVLVRSRADRSESILAGGISINTSGARRSADWDTADFEPATYEFIVRIAAGEESVEDVSTARITIDGGAVLEFTDPFEDVTLGTQDDPNADPNDDAPATVRIRWSGFDPEGSATALIGVDIDDDHESGNEITLREDVELDPDGSFRSTSWDGMDGGQQADAGAYTVFAIVTDGDAEPVIVEADGRIIIDGIPTLEFTAPEENVAFGDPSDPNDPDSDPIETVTIEWTGSDAEGTATAMIGVDTDDDHESGNEIILVEAFELGAEDTDGSFEWDGTDEDGDPAEGGTYTVFAILTDGLNEPVTVAGGATITIDGPPTLEFTAPGENVVFGTPGDPNDPNSDELTSVTIEWTGSDPEGAATAKIGLDIDDDHENDNEIILEESFALGDEDTEGSAEWDGTDADGDPADAGTYTIFAILTNGDDEDDTVIVESEQTVEIPVKQTAVVAPEEDVEFLVGDDPIEIDTEFVENRDVLIDLGADVDDVHTNGNEIVILSQRLIERDDETDTFSWDGDDKDGTPVPDGSYGIYLVVNRGSGTPEFFDGPGLVQRRSAADQPLIALLEPSGETMAEPGAFVLVRWRDDVPEGETATVRLTIDDDNMPNEGVETDDPEIEILADRAAAGDGVQDTFQYQVGALADGEYFIFAYIDRDGVAPFDHIAIAGGRIVIGEMP